MCRGQAASGVSCKSDPREAAGGRDLSPGGLESETGREPLSPGGRGDGKSRVGLSACAPGTQSRRMDTSERSAVAEEKSRIGDRELDTVIGAMHRAGSVLSCVRYERVMDAQSAGPAPGLALPHGANYDAG